MSEVLFTITEKHLETGLRGIPVGYCPTSKVDPQLGLFYRGYPVSELAYLAPEEVIYLLYYGEKPNATQLAEFKALLREKATLDKAVIEHFKALPSAKVEPMKWFLSGLNAAGMLHSTNNIREDCLKLIAILPELVAALFRIHSGWGEPIPPAPHLGYIENFVHMLSPPGAKSELTTLLRVFEVLHLDHGGGNLSTFVGKAVASGKADLFEALVAAMAGLAGPLHGKANQECLRFLKRALGEIEAPQDEVAVKQFLDRLFQRGEKIYGFGHAVLRVEDPRATIQYELGQKLAPADPYFQLALTLRKVGSEYLSKTGKVSNPYPNVDAVSGSLLNAMGLSDDSYYTVLFGLSRCVGIAIQIVYERIEARNGKGTPIVRPKYFYSGPTR